MKRVGFLMILAGVGMGIGSCGLLGRSFQLAMDSRLVHSIPIKLGRATATELLNVSPERSCQLSIQADVTSQSVQEKIEFDEKVYNLRYRFPVSYRIEDEQGKVLCSDQGYMEWEGSRMVSTTSEQVNSKGGTVNVEHSFQKFDAPAGKIKVTAQVSPDTEYGAQAKGLTIKIYDHVSRHGSRMASVGMMSCASPALILLGLVVFISGFGRRKRKR